MRLVTRMVGLDDAVRDALEVETLGRLVDKFQAITNEEAVLPMRDRAAEHVGGNGRLAPTGRELQHDPLTAKGELLAYLGDGLVLVWPQCLHFWLSRFLARKVPPLSQDQPSCGLAPGTRYSQPDLRPVSVILVGADGRWIGSPLLCAALLAAGPR